MFKVLPIVVWVASGLNEAAVATVKQVEQATWASAKFWAAVDGVIDRSDPGLADFSGFCDRLACPSLVDVIDRKASGQVVLTQYEYPNLDDRRVPLPDGSTIPWFPSALASARRCIRKELADVLADEANDHWQPMSWQGSTFLPLRCLPKDAAPLTTRALAPIPRAHRFAGVSRQAPGARGDRHSDHHNFVLSTLTPLAGCDGAGLEVDGIDLALSGDPVLLDNTFDHVVYNAGTTPRFLLTLECFHPDLSRAEQAALSTLFALRDCFALLEFKHRPFGLSDRAAKAMIHDGSVFDLDNWRA